MSVRVHLCGRLRVEWDGERLEGALPGRQGRLLFAFLTLHRDRLVRRDELVEALWSGGRAAPGGDALLRPPLSRLRSALGPGRLEGRGELADRASPTDTWIDREAVRDGLRASRSAYAAGDARASWAAARERGGDRRARAAPRPRGALARAVPRASWRSSASSCWRRSRSPARGWATASCPRPSRPRAGRSRSRRSASRRAWRCSRSCAGAATWPRRSSPSRVPDVPARRARHGARAGAARAARGAAPRRARRQRAAVAAPAAPAARRRAPLPDRLAQALAAPWVGREAALDAAARAGGPRRPRASTRLVLVVGEGGIGKTRLVAELAAGLQGFDVLYGRCDEEEIFPYGPWVDMLRPRLERMGEAELAAVLGPDAPRMRPARAGAAASACPSRRTPRPSSDPETERRLLFAAVTARDRPPRAAAPAAARRRRPPLGRPLVAAPRAPPGPRAAARPGAHDRHLPRHRARARAPAARPDRRRRARPAGAARAARRHGRARGRRADRVLARRGGGGRRRAGDPAPRPRATPSSSSSSCATSRRRAATGA